MKYFLIWYSQNGSARNRIDANTVIDRPVWGWLAEMHDKHPDAETLVHMVHEINKVEFDLLIDIL